MTTAEIDELFRLPPRLDYLDRYKRNANANIIHRTRECSPEVMGA